MSCQCLGNNCEGWYPIHEAVANQKAKFPNEGKILGWRKIEKKLLMIWFHNKIIIKQWMSSAFEGC